MIYKKYLFNSKEQAETKVDAFTELNEEGEKVQTVKADFIWLDKFVLTEGEYDEEGVEIVAPTFTPPYSLDVVWHDLDESPSDWVSFEIEPLTPRHVIY
tara:strand:- start:1640 stop:1936 length:297 start_codon:yes stop_codon:yes gene_type:complete